MVRSTFNWTAIIVYTLFFGVVGLFVSPFWPDFVMRYVARPWARLILFTCGVKVNTHGLEKLSPAPAVIMFNHQSYFDIFAMAAVFPMDWKAIMKKELAMVPIFGWVAKLSGHYFVRRDGSISSVKEIDRVAEKIKHGSPVAIAPEGTRNTEDGLLPFKPGGFLIAIRSRVPVYPVVITGGAEIMGKKSLRISPGVMGLKVLDKIDTSGLPNGKAGRKQLSEQVRSIFERELANESMAMTA